MTPKQVQRLETKIAGIKRTLAAEKRKFGGYDDSRGLRYLPTQYYLQLQDYRGGLNYTRWFAKAFADDAGFPVFLFEWTVILVKSGHLKQAQQKAWQTFCADPELLDHFLDRPLSVPSQPGEVSYVQRRGIVVFPYSSQSVNLADFSLWLADFVAGALFQACRTRFLSIQEQLATERNIAQRVALLQAAAELEAQFTDP